MQKLSWVLQSRKFWAAIISLMGALGVLNWSDAEQAAWVAAIVAGIGAVYQISVALEDGLSAGAVARWFDSEGDE